MASTISEAKHFAKKKITDKYGPSAIFIPPQSGVHGLTKAFIFKPRSLPVSTGGSLELFENLKGADALEAKGFVEAINRDKVKIVPLDQLNVLSGRYQRAYVGGTVEASAPSSVSGHFGVKGEKGIAVGLNIPDTKKNYIKEEGSTMCSLLETFASHYVSLDSKLRVAMNTDGDFEGDVNVVIGFEYEQWVTESCIIRLCAEGAGDVGVGVEMFGLNPKGGAGIDKAKEEMYPNESGTIGAKFLVIHLQKVASESPLGVPKKSVW